SRRGQEVPDEDLHRRGLARPVRPEQADDLALLDRGGDASKRLDLAVTLLQVDELDHASPRTRARRPKEPKSRNNNRRVISIWKPNRASDPDVFQGYERVARLSNVREAHVFRKSAGRAIHARGRTLDGGSRGLSRRG